MNQDLATPSLWPLPGALGNPLVASAVTPCDSGSLHAP
jgi:hypothetical protein